MIKNIPHISLNNNIVYMPGIARLGSVAEAGSQIKVRLLTTHTTLINSHPPHATCSSSQGEKIKVER